ncbi:SWIB/MDM2 domain-containing protein [Aureococcus anophagefferens]|nr:SWIB/MDM2 domain-containing protein [Aureococcus anophagefferens]
MGILDGPLSERATSHFSKYATTPFGAQRALLLESGTPAAPPAAAAAVAPHPLLVAAEAELHGGTAEEEQAAPRGMPYFLGSKDIAGARAASVKYFDQAWGSTHDGEPCPPARYAGWSVVLTGVASEPTKFVDGAGFVYRTKSDAARAMGALAGRPSESSMREFSKYARTPFGAQRALLLESGTPSPPAVVPPPPPPPPPPPQAASPSPPQRAASPPLASHPLDAIALAAQRFGLSLPAPAAAPLAAPRRAAAPGPPAPCVVAAEQLAAAVARAERAEAQVAERDETIRGLQDTIHGHERTIRESAQTVAALEARARRAASARPPPRGSGAILDFEAELHDDDAEEQAVGRSLKQLARHLPLFVGSDDVAGARAGTVQFFDRVYATTHDGEPCPPARYAGWSVVLTRTASKPTRFVDGAGAVYKSRSEAAHAMGILAGQPSELAPVDQKWAETPYGDRRALLFEPGGRSAPPPSPAAAEAPPALEPEVADEEEPAAPAAEAPPAPPAPPPDVADEAPARGAGASGRPARAKPNRVAFTCTDGDPVLESRHGRAQHVSSGGLVVAESATEADAPPRAPAPGARRGARAPGLMFDSDKMMKIRGSQGGEDGWALHACDTCGQNAHARSKFQISYVDGEFAADYLTGSSGVAYRFIDQLPAAEDDDDARSEDEGASLAEEQRTVALPPLPPPPALPAAAPRPLLAAAEDELHGGITEEEQATQKRESGMDVIDGLEIVAEEAPSHVRQSFALADAHASTVAELERPSSLATRRSSQATIARHERTIAADAATIDAHEETIAARDEAIAARDETIARLKRRLRDYEQPAARRPPVSRPAAEAQRRSRPVKPGKQQRGTAARRPPPPPPPAEPEVIDLTSDDERAAPSAGRRGGRPRVTPFPELYVSPAQSEVEDRSPIRKVIRAALSVAFGARRNQIAITHRAPEPHS